MRGDAEGAFAAITVAAVTAVIASFAATAFSAPAGAAFVAAAIPAWLAVGLLGPIVMFGFGGRFDGERRTLRPRAP